MFQALLVHHNILRFGLTHSGVLVSRVCMFFVMSCVQKPASSKYSGMPLFH